MKGAKRIRGIAPSLFTVVWMIPATTHAHGLEPLLNLASYGGDVLAILAALALIFAPWKGIARVSYSMALPVCFAVFWLSPLRSSWFTLPYPVLSRLLIVIPLAAAVAIGLLAHKLTVERPAKGPTD